jgi:DNA-binding transcriptional MocR family regulator
MKLYEQLYSTISQQIESGYFAVNQKLPSIREISQQHKVSISTAQEAYRLLEDTGLAVVRPKSGYYVKLVQPHNLLPDISHPDQKPVQIDNWDEVLALTSTENQRDFLAFGRGTPNTQLSTLKPLQRIFKDIAKNQPQALYRARAGKGEISLREQIVRLMLLSGCALHPDDIVITAGCQEALSLSLKALTKPGDIVAVDSPFFYGSVQAIQSNELKVLEIPTHPETGISLPALELALEQWPIKIIQLVPTSNNPQGYIMPDKNKIKLLKLAEKHDFAIIEDDINGDLVYQSPRPRTIKSFDTEGRVLLCSSFSKTVAPGFRIGWVAAGRYGKVIEHLKFITSYSTPTVPQQVLAEFIKQGYYDKHNHAAKHQYHKNRDQMIRAVRQYFPQGTRMTYPGGGLNLWIVLPENINSFELNEKLHSFNIGIAPGALFNSSGKYKNCMRLNYATLHDDKIEQAIKTIGQQACLLNEKNFATTVR